MMHIRGETHFIPVSGANTHTINEALFESFAFCRMSILQNGTLPLKKIFLLYVIYPGNALLHLYLQGEAEAARVFISLPGR